MTSCGCSSESDLLMYSMVLWGAEAVRAMNGALVKDRRPPIVSNAFRNLGPLQRNKKTLSNFNRSPFLTIHGWCELRQLPPEPSSAYSMVLKTNFSKEEMLPLLVTLTLRKSRYKMLSILNFCHHTKPV